MIYTENNINEKLTEIKNLKEKLKENSNKECILSEINELAETLIDITKNTYNKTNEIPVVKELIRHRRKDNNSLFNALS